MTRPVFGQLIPSSLTLELEDEPEAQPDEPTAPRLRLELDDEPKPEPDDGTRDMVAAMMDEGLL